MANLKKRSIVLNLFSFAAFNLLYFLLNGFNIFFLIFCFAISCLYLAFEWKLVLSFLTPIKKVLKTVSKDSLERPELSTDKIHKQIRLIIDEKNKNEDILNSLIEGVVVLDRDDTVVYANKMAGAIFQDRILKKSFFQLTKNPFLENCQALVENARKTGALKRRTFLFEENQKLYFDLIAIPKANRDLLLIFQDKTADYKNLQMGKEFVSNASHELRTPITIIRGFAETLQDVPKLSSEMLKTICQKIINTSKRLENIISNLLMLADLDNLGNLKLSACSLKELVEKQKSELLFLHKDTEIVLDFCEEEDLVMADRGLLELAFRNILENAIKYSNEKARVEISLQKSEHEFLLAFKDEGIGMSKEDAAHIFERFFTVDKARSRKSGGVGLGLSLVKNIVEKHKGKIEVFSRPGKGSVFSLRLPVFDGVRRID